MAGLMDRPESSRHELSGAAQLQQQPLLKIVTDLVAKFCTGFRYASCLRRMQPCAYLCHALGNPCMATFPLQRDRDLAACSVVGAVWFPPTLHVACLLYSCAYPCHDLQSWYPAETQPGTFRDSCATLQLQSGLLSGLVRAGSAMSSPRTQPLSW